ncbi:carboxymuconolactone decarboxylase family protein [Nonomuraea sp. NPDC049784]|uniref:carboxymuconolactone decarboxylase family protein n=1 Tax=Nonomuraea sp. NPDC049784 TaxID=3154361 RepID=UPI0033D92ADE
MEARMKNPAYVLPDGLKGIQTMLKGVYSAGASQEVLELTALRASQINGCSACVYSHIRNLKKAEESEDRIANVAAWQEAPFYTDAERAALARGGDLSRSHHRTAGRRSNAVPVPAPMRVRHRLDPDPPPVTIKGDPA